MKCPRRTAWLITFQFVLWGLSAQAYGTPELDIGHLAGQVPAPAVLITAPGPLTETQAFNALLAGQFIEVDQTYLQNHGAFSTTIWYAVKLTNSGDFPATGYLEVQNNRLDKVDISFFTPHGKASFSREHLSSGLLVPISRRPVQSPRYFFPVRIYQGSQVLALIRIETQRECKTRIVVQNFTGMDPGIETQDIVTSILLGCLLFVIIFQILMYSLVLRREYLFFVLASTFVGLYATLMSVPGSLLFFPEYPAVQQYFPFLFYALGMGCVLEYFRLSLELSIHARAANRLVLAVYLLIPLFSLLCPFLPHLSVLGALGVHVLVLAFFLHPGLRCPGRQHQENGLDKTVIFSVIASDVLLALDYLGLPDYGVFSFVILMASRAGLVLAMAAVTYSLFQKVQKLLSQKEDAEERERISRAFLSGMSHEMRSPLNGIIGFAQNLDPGMDREQIAHFRARIEEEARVLLQKVDRILDVVRCETGKLEINPIRFSPSVMLRQVYSQWEQEATRKGLELVLEVDGALNTLVLSDRMRLEQMLSLLLDNAVKFTPQGTVRLSGQVLGINGDGMECRFSVIDTGPGISASRMAEIFRLPQSHPQKITQEPGHGYHAGMGVGLSLTQRLCKILQGKFRVESVEGQGSEFSVDLVLPHARKDLMNSRHAGVDVHESSHPPRHETAAPLFESAAAVSEAHEEEMEGQDLPLFGHDSAGVYPVSPPRILVVDDLPTNRQVIAIHLSRSGLVIDEAEDGQQALDLVAKQAYDLVLMDIYMPGIDGFEATRRIRKSFSASRLPVIGITASTEENDLRECIASGMNCFLLKPLSREKLLSIMGNFISISQ